MKSKKDIQVYELLQEEIQKVFVDKRLESRQVACENIAKLQNENRKTYNLRRRPNSKYKVGDIVAIPMSQFGVGRKVKKRFFGPYKIVQIFANERCAVRKLDDEEEGPMTTTTAFDQLKPWEHPGRM